MFLGSALTFPFDSLFSLTRKKGARCDWLNHMPPKAETHSNVIIYGVVVIIRINIKYPKSFGMKWKQSDDENGWKAFCEISLFIGLDENQ